jgi:hypothetical protein
VSSRAGVSCALASAIAPPSFEVSPAGRMSAAVVLFAHGVGEGLAPCRRELAVDVAVLIAGVPTLL